MVKNKVYNLSVYVSMGYIYTYKLQFCSFLSEYYASSLNFKILKASIICSISFQNVSIQANERPRWTSGMQRRGARGGRGNDYYTNIPNGILSSLTINGDSFALISFDLYTDYFVLTASDLYAIRLT